MPRSPTRQPQLHPADIVDQLANDMMILAERMRSEARSHRECENRAHEGERISGALRRLFRGVGTV